MATLAMTKHHGLGNDFLVLIDLEDRHHLTDQVVSGLCERHRGVGADGLIRVLPGSGGAAVSMELRNSDGSRAEMSGNGIRCLAQAVVDAGVVRERDFAVATDAGVRSVSVRGGGGRGVVEVIVEMGVVALDARVPAGLPGKLACEVSVGNPHLVLLFSDVEGLAPTDVGPVVNSMLEDDVNVELLAAGPAEGEVSIRIWERGAGETLASGTGSTAAAAAARHWGLTGDRVVVNNPGGRLAVDLSGTMAVLAGEAVHVARIEVDIP